MIHKIMYKIKWVKYLHKNFNNLTILDLSLKRNQNKLYLITFYENHGLFFYLDFSANDVIFKFNYRSPEYLTMNEYYYQDS
jgi:hypothetical protein